MKNSTLKFALLISFALNISVLGAAGFMYYKDIRPAFRLFDSSGEKGNFLFEKLSLTPEQLGAMRERAHEFHAEIDKRSREIVVRRKTLISLIRAENADNKSIDAAASEIGRLQKEIQRIVVSHLLVEKNNLDKDQNEKFFNLLEQSMSAGIPTPCPPLGEH